MRRHCWHSRIAALLLIPVALVAAQGGSDASRAESRMPTITVRVFDYASVPAAIARRAREETSRIFRDAGVAIQWVRCPVQRGSMEQHPRCRDLPLATDIQLNILPRPMARKMRKHHREFGVAFPLPGGFGSRASIFYHRVEELAERQGAPRALLLGHFVAHEIGHLLLGENSHSNTGLMRVPWDKAQREKAYLGTLLFTPEEASRVRSQAAARELAAASGR